MGNLPNYISGVVPILSAIAVIFTVVLHMFRARSRAQALLASGVPAEAISLAARQRCLILTLLATLWGADAFAQTGPGKGPRPNFSSAYTDPKRDCKGIAPTVDAETCKGYGGYSILLSYPAMSQDLFIEAKDGTSIPVYPREAPVKYLAGKIEWRLAGGKPFAVIVRFSYHSVGDDPKTGGIKLDKVGEVLFVKGLKGYEKMEFVVDPKTPRANEKAREMADNAFLQGR